MSSFSFLFFLPSVLAQDGPSTPTQPTRAIDTGRRVTPVAIEHSSTSGGPADTDAGKGVGAEVETRILVAHKPIWNLILNMSPEFLYY